jgi:hypothetical protein
LEVCATVSENPAVAAAIELCEGFRARDWDRVVASLGDEISFAVRGGSPLAGQYEGADAVVGLMRRMVDLSGDTLRFAAGPDSYDVLVSDAHVAVLVPFSAERDGRALEFSYQIWQFHAGPRLGGYGGLYVADQAAFDAFWT